MHNPSVVQALDVWSDLESAYHGVNGFGGSTAEIYMYRLMPANPTYETVMSGRNLMGDHGSAAVKEHLKMACTSLYNLLEHFRESKSDTIKKIFINDRAFGKWVSRADFSHRIHVRIEKKNHE